MLPLSRDRIRIAFAPGSVSGLRIAGALRPRVTEKHVVSCPPESPAAWQGALAALAELLPLMKRGAAEVSLILSHRFVRYALVPWSDNLSSPREELAYARHRFAGIYGDDAGRWEIRLSPGGPGEPRVACAVEPELLKALRDSFGNSRLRLRSIQPYLMAAYNLWRRALNGGDRLFLVAENRLYACAAFRGGQWCGVHTGAVADDGFMDELPVILDRERVWADFDERPPVFVHAPELPGISAPTGQSWKVNALHLPAQWGFSPLSDARYGMAMSLE